MLNVSKQDVQRSTYSLTACRVGDIEVREVECFGHLQYPFWVVNPDLFVEYVSAGFVSKWLFDVMMLGKDLIFYGETDVVYRIGWDIQRLWRVEREKDPGTVPFYHARLPVHSWMSGRVSTNMYQFDVHTVWIGKTTRCDKKVYTSLLLFFTPWSAQALAHCITRYVSFLPPHLELPDYLMYSARHVEEMQNKNLGGFMPLIYVLWYLDKFVVDCRNIDAVVVVDATPAVDAKIGMLETRTKLAFLALSAIR